MKNVYQLPKGGIFVRLINIKFHLISTRALKIVVHCVAIFLTVCNIKLTTQFNDILVRSEKHDISYYYGEDSTYFEDLRRIVTDKKALYKIFDSGVSRKANYVCPTLTANMGTFPDRVPIILDDYGIRRITPYECLALQGFPRDFRFPKIPMASAYKQCGNSVVVSVIRRIAKNIKKVFE